MRVLQNIVDISVRSRGLIKGGEKRRRKKKKEGFGNRPFRRPAYCIYIL